MELRLVESVEAVSLIGLINRKKKLHQKLLLDGIELVMSKDSPEFLAVRKLILDNTNDFSRSVVRAIFGDDFEGFIK